MISIYHDFKNGLRDVHDLDIVNEFNFVYKNKYTFAYVPLWLAYRILNDKIDETEFVDLLNSECGIEEGGLFRCIAKLQNQVMRRMENDTPTLYQIEDDINRLEEEAKAVLDSWIEYQTEDEDDDTKVTSRMTYILDENLKSVSYDSDVDEFLSTYLGKLSSKDRWVLLGNIREEIKRIEMDEIPNDFKKATEELGRYLIDNKISITTPPLKDIPSGRKILTIKYDYPVCDYKLVVTYMHDECVSKGYKFGEGDFSKQYICTKTIFDMRANVKKYYNPHKDIFDRFGDGIYHPDYVEFLGDGRSGVGLWMLEAGYSLYYTPSWWKDWIYSRLENKIDPNKKYLLEQVFKFSGLNKELSVE